MSLKRKDLLSLAPLSVDEVKLLLETADSFKEVLARVAAIVLLTGRLPRYHCSADFPAARGPNARRTNRPCSRCGDDERDAGAQSPGTIRKGFRPLSR